MTVKLQAEDILRVRYALAKRVLQCRRPGESIKDATARLQRVILLTSAGFELANNEGIAPAREDQLVAEVHTLQMEVERLKMTNKVLAGKVADLQATTDAPPAKGKGKKPSKSNAPQVVPRVAMVLDEIKMSGLAKRIGVDVSDIEPGLVPIDSSAPSPQKPAKHWHVLLALRSLQLACQADKKAPPHVSQEEQLSLIHQHTGEILCEIRRRIDGLVQGWPRTVTVAANPKSASQQLQSLTKLCTACLLMTLHCLSGMPAAAAMSVEDSIHLEIRRVITALCRCFATHSQTAYASVSVSSKQPSPVTTPFSQLDARSAAYDMLYALCAIRLPSEADTDGPAARLRSFSARVIQSELVKKVYESLQHPDLQVDPARLTTKDERLQHLLSIAAIQDTLEYHCKMLGTTLSVDTGSAEAGLPAITDQSGGVMTEDVDDHRMMIMLDWCLDSVSADYAQPDNSAMKDGVGKLPSTILKNLGQRTTSIVFETIDSIILARGPDLVDQAMQRLLLLE